MILRNLALAIGIGLAFVASAFLTFAGQLGIVWITGLLGLPEDSPVAAWTVRLVSLLVVFAARRGDHHRRVPPASPGVRPSARSLWSGALLVCAGSAGLQELSSLFVGGATSNPLLASFASLLALLIWLNFSAQVMLFACAYIVTAEEESTDRVHARYAATTFPERRLQRAEVEVRIATAERRAAQKAAAADAGS